jgi:hypothetical protein
MTSVIMGFAHLSVGIYVTMVDGVVWERGVTGGR